MRFGCARRLLPRCRKAKLRPPNAQRATGCGWAVRARGRRRDTRRQGSSANRLPGQFGLLASAVADVAFEAMHGEVQATEAASLVGLLNAADREFGSRVLL